MNEVLPADYKKSADIEINGVRLFLTDEALSEETKDAFAERGRPLGGLLHFGIRLEYLNHGRSNDFEMVGLIEDTVVSARESLDSGLKVWGDVDLPRPLALVDDKALLAAFAKSPRFGTHDA